MTTMLDKLSEVIDERVRASGPIWDYDAKEIARAALQAIRVPDAGMIEAGESAAWDKGNSMPTIRAMPIGYTAMIDAILSESA